MHLGEILGAFFCPNHATPTPHRLPFFVATVRLSHAAAPSPVSASTPRRASPAAQDQPTRAMCSLATRCQQGWRLLSDPSILQSIEHGRFSLIANSLPIFWVDAILLFTLGEWLVLSIRSTRTPQGLRFADISAGLLPGWLLMLALRLAAPPELSIEVFVCLSLAGMAHAVDFYRRYRSSAGAHPWPQ